MSNTQIPKPSKANTPSPEAIRAMLRFMMRTSVPRLVAEELAKREEKRKQEG